MSFKDRDKYGISMKYIWNELGKYLDQPRSITGASTEQLQRRIPEIALQAGMLTVTFLPEICIH